MTVYVDRKAASFHLDGGRIDVVQDNVGYVANVPVGAGTQQRTFLAAPYGSIGNIRSSVGARGDKLTIQLDGGHIISGPEGVGDADYVLQSLFDEPLRRRRVDYYRLDLDPDTMDVAAVKHKFAGRIDDAYLDRSDPARPIFIIQLTSYRVHAANPEAAIYSDIDQRSMYANDGGFKHLEDVVFRDGEFQWNKEGAGSGRDTSGRPFTPGGPQTPVRPPRTIYR
jgi:hypothetical protein